MAFRKIPRLKGIKKDSRAVQKTNTSAVMPETDGLDLSMPTLERSGIKNPNRLGHVRAVIVRENEDDWWRMILCTENKDASKSVDRKKETSQRKCGLSGVLLFTTRKTGHLGRQGCHSRRRSHRHRHHRRSRHHHSWRQVEVHHNHHQSQHRRMEGRRSRRHR